jgi:transcriptional regulator with XRE-family HTH domain
MKTMGKRIAQKREERHMTMEELGAKLAELLK